MVDIITRAALLLLTSMVVLMITLFFDTSKYFGSFEVSFGYGCLQAAFYCCPGERGEAAIVQSNESKIFGKNIYVLTLATTLYT
jgi:hypothetical protein